MPAGGFLSSSLSSFHSLPVWFPGEFGCPGARGDQQEDAGPDADGLRGRPAADLHADAQRLLPSLPVLDHLQVPPPQQPCGPLTLLGPGSDPDPDPNPGPFQLMPVPASSSPASLLHPSRCHCPPPTFFQSYTSFLPLHISTRPILSCFVLDPSSLSTPNYPTRPSSSVTLKQNWMDALRLLLTTHRVLSSSSSSFAIGCHSCQSFHS